MLDDDWKEIPLGEILTLQRGFDLPHRQRQPGSIPIVSSSGISDKHSQAMVSGPGVVTGRYGTIGQVFFINEDFWPLNTTLFVRDFRGNDPLFISFLLRRIDFQSYSGKTGVPGVNRNDLHQIIAKLPPLPEQRAIAAVLSDVDALIAALDRLIAKKRAIKQGAMQQLLTSQTRLPGFSEPWEVAQIASLLTRPATYGIVKAGSFQTSGIPMVRGGDIKNGKIALDLPFVTKEKSDEYARTIVQQGDVLIALVGYPGESAKVPESLNGANISRAVGLLRPGEKILPDYLVCYLNSPVGRKNFLTPSAGSAQLVVNLKDLNLLQIPLPGLAEQKSIATILSDMDAEIAALEARRAKTRALKQGMMQELLTGRTRLV